MSLCFQRAALGHVAQPDGSLSLMEIAELKSPTFFGRGRFHVAQKPLSDLTIHQQETAPRRPVVKPVVPRRVSRGSIVV